MSEILRSTMNQKAQGIVKNLDKLIDARLKQPEHIHRPIKITRKQMRILDNTAIKGTGDLVYRGFRIEV